MEAFEHLVKVMLEAQGHVVTTNVKFPVRMRTKKRQVVEHQTHGYEVDIVGAKADLLILGSVKSFLGSKGVNRQGFQGITDTRPSKRTDFPMYKLFNNEGIRQGVLQQACNIYGYPEKAVQFMLYVGKFASDVDKDMIREHLGTIHVGAGPIKVVGLHEILDVLIEHARSKTYIDDPVIVTIKSLALAGMLKD